MGLNEDGYGSRGGFWGDEYESRGGLWGMGMGLEVGCGG